MSPSPAGVCQPYRKQAITVNPRHLAQGYAQGFLSAPAKYASVSSFSSIPSINKCPSDPPAPRCGTGFSLYPERWINAADHARPEAPASDTLSSIVSTSIQQCSRAAKPQQHQQYQQWRYMHNMHGFHNIRSTRNTPQQTEQAHQQHHQQQTTASTATTAPSAIQQHQQHNRGRPMVGSRRARA